MKYATVQFNYLAVIFIILRSFLALRTTFQSFQRYFISFIPFVDCSVTFLHIMKLFEPSPVIVNLLWLFSIGSKAKNA